MKIHEQRPRINEGDSGKNRYDDVHKKDPIPREKFKCCTKLKDGEQCDGAVLIETAHLFGKQWSDCKLSSAQLRKYYHEVVAIYIIAKSQGWDKVALQFKLLKAKAAYGLREKNKQYSMRDLVNFIQWATEDVNDFKTLEMFKNCFEAAVGFYYGYGANE